MLINTSNTNQVCISNINYTFYDSPFRVQRVPETEKAGRMHSSTVTLVVMPEVPKEFNMDEKDVRIDTFRASGAGG